MDRSAKPLTTYARRRKRLGYLQRRADGRSPSSPLEELAASKDDLTLEEMSSRMKKRSRQASSGRQEMGGDDGPNERGGSGHSPKRQKHVALPKDCLTTGASEPEPLTGEHGSIPVTPLLAGNRPPLPLATQRINDSIFETPFPSDQTILRSYLVSVEDGPLSPVPLGRRILSRTSSRNFKENQSQDRSLASPFHSRSASRSSSPLKPGSKRLPTLHNKSRTLSSNSLRQDKKFPSITQSSVSKDSIFDTTKSMDISISQAAHDKTMHLHSHTRTASIPNVSSHLLGNISPVDWLIPPKVLNRSNGSQEEVNLDVFQVEFPSFYSDMPVEVSTPSRQRQSTVTYKNAHLAEAPRPTSSYVLSDDDDDDVPIVTTDPRQSPRQPRRHRRTVVHMSSDSIFSSALDFSAYMTDHSPTPVVTQGSVANTFSPAKVSDSSRSTVPALDSAFSPATIISTQLNNDNRVQTQSSPSTHATERDHHAAVLSTPETECLGPTCAPRSVIYESAGDDELHGMFFKLALKDSLSALQSADNSDLGFNEVAICSPAQSSNTDRPKGPEMTHRRKRGDTIRAADFIRAPQPPEVISPMRFSLRSAHADHLPPNTRRTRSGTVTLARSAARPGGATRRREGLPTIKMRIDDPLPPQGSDEEDDELLIVKNKAIVLGEARLIR